MMVPLLDWPSVIWPGDCGPFPLPLVKRNVGTFNYVQLCVISFVSLLTLVVAHAGTMDFSTLANVLTSIPFVLLGLSDIRSLTTSQSTRGLPFRVFVLSLIPVGIGSILYHWSPSTAHLLWDRLPIAICLAAFACTVANEYFQTDFGSTFLAPSLLLSVATVLYWYLTATHGHEDLRPYAAVQGCAAGFCALVVFIRPGQSAGTAGLRWALAVYAAGRGVEFFQQEIYRRVEIDIGHPAKHLLVAVAAFLIIRSLRASRTRQHGTGTLQFETAASD